MAAEIHWNFITDKYSMVDYIDLAIVAARFKQEELLRILISIRHKILAIKKYDEFKPIQQELLELKNSIADERLMEIVMKIIDQITGYLKTPMDIDKQVEPTETEISD